MSLVAERRLCELLCCRLLRLWGVQDDDCCCCHPHHCRQTSTLSLRLPLPAPAHCHVSSPVYCLTFFDCGKR